MDSISKISITCFAASYSIVLALELARVFLRAEFLQTKVARFFKVGFALAGLVAHSMYLACHGGLEVDSIGLWFGGWFGWCLAASWLLAVAYIWISLWRTESVFGLFLLPCVILLTWTGAQFGDSPGFSSAHARSVWSMIHGAALLLGSSVVALGCIFGCVYLIQSYRLKHKLPRSPWFRLPSLEWLQQSAERSLIFSAVLLGIGLISGVAINYFSAASAAGFSAGEPNAAEFRGSIAWSDPVIWSSGILFAWLASVTVFHWLYRPARQGRKVAYLVVASFLFLMIELGIVWWVGHATQNVNASASPGVTLRNRPETTLFIPNPTRKRGFVL